MSRLQSRAALDRPVTTRTILQPISEFTWQQLPDTSGELSISVNTGNKSSIDTTQNTHTPDSQQKVDEESETLPLRGISGQKFVPNTELLQEINTRSKPVPLLINSQKGQPEIQETDNDKTANISGDEKILPLTISAPRTDDTFVRDDDTKEFYKPLSSIIVLKREKRDAARPIDFKKALTVDALVDSGDNVSECHGLNRIGKNETGSTHQHPMI